MMVDLEYQSKLFLNTPTNIEDSKPWAAFKSFRPRALAGSSISSSTAPTLSTMIGDLLTRFDTSVVSENYDRLNGNVTFSL